MVMPIAFLHSAYIHPARFPAVKYVTGKLLMDGPGSEGLKFVPGYIGFGDGVIKEVGKGQKKDALAKGLILPSLTNAHTHLGDSCLRASLRKYKGERSVPALFCPPHGFKHRHLAKTPSSKLESGMRAALREMARCGVARYCDFREGGVKGLRALGAARKGAAVKGLALGRPAGLGYDRDETDSILEMADGIAVSAISDWEYPELQKLAAHTKRSRRIFALHASEIIREDIDLVLDLKPDFLVHMVQASDFDLERVASEGIPIVVCPRANSFFGLRPRIGRMLGFGIPVALGTDNAMISSPGILPVLQDAWEVSRQMDTRPSEIMACALSGFRKVLSVPDGIPLGPGNCADFFVVENPEMYTAKDPLAALVALGSGARVALASVSGSLWK